MRLIGILAIVYLALKFVVLAAFWILAGPAVLIRVLILHGARRQSADQPGALEWIVMTRDRLIDQLDSAAMAFRNWLGRIFGLSDDPLW